MRLANKRVLLTQAGEYMGPAIDELFTAEGATVIRSTGLLTDQAMIDAALTTAGEIDVLVANLALSPQTAAVGEIADADWQALFDALVHPLMRLVRGVTPGMQQRGHGKIVAVTSAAPLRGINKSSAYCAARGAQNAFIRAAGLELAASNIQVNAIAQNWVKNPTYFTDEMIASERFQAAVQRSVPRKALAESQESAELALFLASDASKHMVGQVLPFCGGWATTTG